MGNKSPRTENKDIIGALAERYPEAFFTTPHRVIPLSDGIIGEIFYDLGKVPSDFKKELRRAISWYEAWPDYLRAVAFGEHKRNLAGNKMDRPSLPEREAARDKLIERGLWTKRASMIFKVSLGRKEAANR